MRESIWSRLSKSVQRIIQKFCKTPGEKVGSLLRDFGLELRLERLPETVSGYLIYDPTVPVSAHAAVVNSLHPETRKRFTAAHELGHYLLEHDCSIPDDHISPRRSAFFMARSVLRDIRGGGRLRPFWLFGMGVLGGLLAAQ